MPEFGQNQKLARHRLVQAINAERDRRVSAGFVFQGHRFDFDQDSAANITGAGASAGIAMALGAEQGNLRWADPEKDFSFLSQDNVWLPMDAHTCFAFSQAALRHKHAHIRAARSIKDTVPVPQDFTNDVFWP